MIAAISSFGINDVVHICLLLLSQVLHELQPLILLVNVNLLVEQLRGIFILLLVDALAFPIQTLLVLPLLVIDVLLETTMHFERRVEPVLDGVVGAPRHMLRYQRPLLAVLQKQIHQLLVLVQRPLVPSNVRIKVIVPALPALLANSPRQHRSNKIPAFGTMLDDHVFESLVLLLGPGALLASLHLVLLLQAEVL